MVLGKLSIGFGVMVRMFLNIICLLPFFFSSGCMKKIPYEPDQVNTFFKREENVQLAFSTPKGKQVAFYIPPLDHPEQAPHKLYILYPGIESVALEWLSFIKLEEDPRAGYLLIDYPGRGYSEGIMNPNKIYLNTEGALNTLADHFDIEKIDAELSLLGYSFGTGSVLQYAARSSVERIVLVAPFNTLRKALAQLSVLLSLVTPAQINNVKLIKELLQRENPPEITIFHGAKDASLPVEMGRELANINPDFIQYHEIPQGDHSSILTTHRDLIFHSLLGISKR